HIFTNGDTPHANRTTDRLGISEHFHAVFDIVAAGLEPKPAAATYRKFLLDHEVEPKRAAMFEDMPRNLDVPRKLGMRTVLVVPAKDSYIEAEAWEHEEDGSPIDFRTDHLDTFLADVLEALEG
ncbi:HAD-IA family hydrolase, partial [Rhizobiaceae bacterium]|nr:HAD-IA family hydrolase [Rhizobiaceae bacterium]